MNDTRYSLCPQCDACPEVVIERDEVRIGEEGNIVRLTNEQWDTLVDGIRSGKLASQPPTSEDGACGCGCACECC